MPRGLGATQQKILLLLGAGVALALSSSPQRSFRVIKIAARAWRDINMRELQRSIRKLYASKLITAKDNPDGSTTIELTQEGQRKVITHNMDQIKIKKPRLWDKKWRIILFDIPERRRKVRDAIRYHLRQLGCYELQKSVFVHPFECRDEIDFIIEHYHARPFVRFIRAEYLDNELHIKQKFKHDL